MSERDVYWLTEELGRLREHIQTQAPRLTRREQFAMAAMQGLLASDERVECDFAAEIAALAVRLADALAKELDDKP